MPAYDRLKLLLISGKSGIILPRWPGNVRELKNLTERLAVTVRDRIVLPVHLPLEIVSGTPTPRKDRSLGGRMLKDIEREAIEQTLRQVTSHREKAAKLLGISPRALRYKIKEYGITVD